METKNTTIDGTFDATATEAIPDIQVVDRLMIALDCLRRNDSQSAHRIVYDLLQDILKKQEKTS